MDSAYASDKIDATLKERGYKPQIYEKGYRNKPLMAEQKANNRLKSKVRCRIEHVFGEQKDADKGRGSPNDWSGTCEVLDWDAKFDVQ